MTSFAAPTSQQLDEVSRRLLDPQLRRAFFEGLNNPHWLKPLAQRGYFADPPEPEEVGDGLVRELYWPELDYLTRMAPHEPKEVVDVLLKFSASNNSWVRRSAFSIGAAIPAADSARLQPLLRAWLPTGWGWRSDPREMVDLAINLIKGGRGKVGKWVANVLFRPAPGDPSQRRPKLLLEEYWYSAGLPRLVVALGDDGLDVVLPWLEEYERQSGHVTDTYDASYLYRDAIRERTGHSAHESVEQSLIDAVRDLSSSAMVADPAGTAKALLRSGMVLTRKIALYASAEALALPGKTTEEAQALVSSAVVLLFDDASRDDACRIEYGELCRAVAGIAPTVLLPLSGFLARGPLVGMEELRSRLHRDPDETPQELERNVAAYLDGWRHRWLAAIGIDALPTDLKTEIDRLDASLGVIENPLSPPVTTTSWTGPNGPISVEEMAVMSPTQLVDHLEGWHGAGDGWGPEPSHEGQGRILTALLTTNPDAVAGVSRLVERLRPTYLRAIMQGWLGALKSGSPLDWTQAAEVIQGVLGHPNESDFPVEGGDFDDDRDFRWATRAAVDLLVELARERTDQKLMPPEMLDAYARLLITEAADETAWTEYDSFEGDGGTDALTTSLNAQWPIRLRGLTYLATNPDGAAWRAAALAALDFELSRTDKRGAGRAVLGEGIGRLLVRTPDWLHEHLEELVGSERGVSRSQQIVMTTAIATHRYHRDLYDLLRGSMIAGLGCGESLSAGWRGDSDPPQRIGEWVIDALIVGDKTPDDPLARAFFTSTSAAVRGEAMDRVAWSIAQAEKLDDALRDRFAQLWDDRITHVKSHPDDSQELNGFYWLAKGKKFQVSWWLPRLSEVLQIEPAAAAHGYMISEELAGASNTDPKNALDVLQRLLNYQEARGVTPFDLAGNAIAVVIANAMSSGDDALKEEADQYMNELGGRGNHGLESAVTEVLNPRGEVGSEGSS